jgi:hypothetical protein
MMLPVPWLQEQNDSSQQKPFSPAMSVPSTTMSKGDFGSGGSMSMTLQRGKLEFVMPTPVEKGPKLDDGGSGGDIGKNNRNGEPLMPPALRKLGILQHCSWLSLRSLLT